ncbi:MAG: hypothetical protein A2287_04175 [Candidatus Melainabacteria bacterium RIFOXYA12_FULL_32_12]|nr:MAG: hypothetical protein A2287_04175 [Candidatus Melainabacteria bacterium RIFOXYA12_FULL_32_12]
MCLFINKFEDMNKLVILYISFAILVLITGIITFTIPANLFEIFSFNIFFHRVFEAIIALLAFFVFLSGNQIYSRTPDRRIAVISGGFLAGSILKVFHILSSFEFPYDVLTAENFAANPEIIYLLIGDLIFAIAIFMSTFYSRDTSGKPDPLFRRKVYTGFLVFALLIILLDIILRPILLILVQEYTYKFILIDASLETAIRALYLLSAFIYADIRLTSKSTIASTFIVALFVLGLTTLYGIYGHAAQLIGFLLLVIGIKEIPLESAYISFRQRFSAYLSLFLIVSYLFFVTLTSVVFNIRFPAFAPYIFIEFFIIAIIVQYILSNRFIDPINNLIQGVEEFKLGEEPEKIPVSTQDEIGMLTARINDIIELNWEYTQELLSKQEQDRIRLSIVNKLRSALSADEVLNGVVNIIGDTFKPEEVIILNLDNKTGDLYPTQYEYRSGPDIPSLTKYDFSRQQGLEQIYSNIEKKELIAVSDFEQENIDEYTTSFFKKMEIKSFLILPMSYKNEILSCLMLCYFSKSHYWSKSTINLIKSLESQISTVIYQARLYTSTNDIAKREYTLRRIINLVLTSLDINDVFEVVTREVGLLLNLDNCVLRLYNPQTGKLEPGQREYRADITIPSTLKVQYPEEVNQLIKHVLFEEMRPIIIDDVDASNLGAESKEFARNYELKSAIALPILHNEEPLAVLLAVQTKYKRKWTEEDVNTLIPIVDQIAIAIYQSQLFTSTKMLAQREQLLREIMVTSIRSLSTKEAIKSIVTQTGELFKADRCFFIGYNAKTQEYLPVESYGSYISSLIFKDVGGLHVTREQMSLFTKIVIDQQRVLAVNDSRTLEVPDETKYIIEKYAVKSFIVAPMFYRDIPLGLLIVDYVNSYKQFNQNDIDLMSAVANQSSIVVYQAQLYDQIQETSDRERLLRTIINEVLTSTSLKEAVQSITFEVGILFDVDRVAIRFYDETFRVFSEVVGEYKRDESVPSAIGMGSYPKEVDEYLATELFDKKNTLIVNDINDPKYPEPLREEYKRLGVISTIAVPVFYQNNSIAILVITNTTPKKAWEKEDIDILNPIVQQISIGINLFRLNERLKKSLDNERIVREMIIEVRKLETHDQIYDYLLTKLAPTFNVDRSLHLHEDDKANLYIQNEYIADKERYKSLYKQTLLCAECINEIRPVPEQAIPINNVDEEIRDIEFREYLKSNEIQALLLYPTSRRVFEAEHEEITGITLITSSSPRKWTSDEVDLFKLMIDAASIVFFEASQRQELDETRRTFIATLTHDLKSPIIAEQKAIEFMTSRDPVSPLKDYIEYLEDIYNTNEELLRIVNNMLSVYQYESGMIVLNIQPGNVKNVIEEAIRSLKYLARAEESNIIVDIEPDLPLVMMDRTEINRVLVNLISNAIKHNKKGTQITIAAKKINNEVQVSVKDNGRGVSEVEKPKIFQRYPTTKREVGTGLGLYLSKQIVELHNGRIWFESEINKGTTFYFTLPVA